MYYIAINKVASKPKPKQTREAKPVLLKLIVPAES